MPYVIEVTAESSLSTESVNVWHWRVPNSALVTEVNTCITALDTFYEAIKTYLSSQTILIGFRTKTVDQTPNLLVGGTSQTTVSTTGTPTVLSACVVLSLGSTIIGGSRRGRKYLGPLVDGAKDSTGRQVSSGAITTITTAATALMGTTTNGVQLGVWSRKTNTFTAVTSINVNPILGTQRRRLN